MNRQFLLAFDLQRIFFLSIGVAVVIPLIALIVISLNSLTTITTNNLSSYVVANGERHTVGIRNAVAGALNDLETFLNEGNNEEIIAEPLSIRFERGTVGDGQLIENRASTLILNRLVSNDAYSSGWLLTTTGVPFSVAIAPGQEAPFSVGLANEANSEVFQRGQSMDQQDLAAVVLTTRRDEPSIEIIRALFNDEDDKIGYLVGRLDLDAVISSNLIEDGSINTQSFVIFPDNQLVIAGENDQLALFDPNSLGAQRAINDEATAGVERYNRQLAEDSSEQVIGYYAPIFLTNADERLALVSEVEQSVIFEQIVLQVTPFAFPLLIGTFLVILLMSILLNQLIVPPLVTLQEGLQAMIRGNFAFPVMGQNRGAEISGLVTSFVDMREQVRTLNEEMERRLTVRTRDVRVTQGITRTIAAERDLQRLMDSVVDEIIKNFDSIYHAQIFLLDEHDVYAVLRASTGEAGRQLLQRGHKLAIGSVSVIGQVTEQAQIMLARNTAESDVHRRNEFLQETEAELAIPLRLGDRTIGALDVQSRERDSFDEDLISALQTLADQVSVAIENARLYQESARLIESVERESGQASARAWQQFLASRRTAELSKRAGVATDYDFDALSGAVMRTGESIVGEPTPHDSVPVAVPLQFRGRTLGVVEFELPQGAFSRDAVLLAEELSDRLALGLENARLFQSSQQAVERERIVNNISAQLTGQTDIERIIETAIRELGIALRTPRVGIRITPDLTQSNNNPNGNGSVANGRSSTANGTGPTGQPTSSTDESSSSDE